jgi:hypothetical protein
MALRPLPAGIEQDPDVDAALRWLASVSCDPPAFWRRIEAAQKLGIGRNTITRKIQELGLDD